nr:hypothetical protein FNV92_14420 [Bradyrhizobium cosmicum]
MGSFQTSSLRAQRSNPACLWGKILDCFAALAMTEDMDRASETAGRAKRRPLTPSGHTDTTSTRSASRPRASSPPDSR